MDGKYRIKEKNRKKYAYVIGVTFFCAFFLFIQVVRVNAEEKTAALAEKIEAVHGYVLSVDHNPTLESTWYVIGTKRSDQGAPTAWTVTPSSLRFIGRRATEAGTGKNLIAASQNSVDG